MSNPFRSHRAIALLVAVVGLLAAAAPARADLLPVAPVPDGPVIFSFDGLLSYDDATKVLDVSSLDPATLSAMFGDADIENGSASINLLVNADGSFAANGSGLTVSGDIDFDGDGIDDASGLLLAGSITAFGAQSAGPPTWLFNALYDIQAGALTGPVPLSGGGSLAALYPTTKTGLVTVAAENVTSGTLGDFTADFGSDTVKSDAALATPEPSTLALLLAGGLTAAVWQRRARRGGHSTV